MNDLQNFIVDQLTVYPSEDPVFIYIGIGTAAGLRNAAGVLEPANYHQFPPFVQDLRNTIANLHVLLILIDPYQEQPPYLVHDKGLTPINRTSNIFGTDGLAVYVLRQDVYTVPDTPHRFPEKAVDLTPFLTWLNALAVRERLTTVYHDFTGRQVSRIAEYFDGDLRHNLDHIVYGLSAREHHGCYFDLTAVNAYFPFRVDRTPGKRALIRLFNIYEYITTGTIAAIPADKWAYPPYMHAMIDVQKEQVTQVMKTDLRNVMFSNLRQVYHLISNQDDGTFVRFLGVSHGADIQGLIDQRAYGKLSDYFQNCYAARLETVAQLKQMDLTGAELLELLTVGDPYGWYDNIPHFF